MRVLTSSLRVVRGKRVFVCSTAKAELLVLINLRKYNSRRSDDDNTLVS